MVDDACSRHLTKVFRSRTSADPRSRIAAPSDTVVIAMASQGHIQVRYNDFPAEEKAAFRRVCGKLGLAEGDFELNAEVENLDLASWRARPHVVVVHHIPSSRTRVCAGWTKKSWLDVFEDFIRKHPLPAYAAVPVAGAER